MLVGATLGPGQHLLHPVGVGGVSWRWRGTQVDEDLLLFAKVIGEGRICMVVVGLVEISISSWRTAAGVMGISIASRGMVVTLLEISMAPRRIVVTLMEISTPSRRMVATLVEIDIMTCILVNIFTRLVMALVVLVLRVISAGVMEISIASTRFLVPFMGISIMSREISGRVSTRVMEISMTRPGGVLWLCVNKA